MVALTASMIEVLLLGILTMMMFISISVGRHLHLYSDEILAKYSFLGIKATRWLVYAATGMVWILSKTRFPGIELFVTYGNDNKIGQALRAAYWKSKVKSLGKNVIVGVGARAVGWECISIGDESFIDRNVYIETGNLEISGSHVTVKSVSSEVNNNELRIGKGCHIAPNVVIQCYGGVKIGDFTSIASGGKIYSLSHHYKTSNKNDKRVFKFTPRCAPEQQSLIMGPVVFEGNNALGLNSVILPGVRIGLNSWIGVSSYVVDDIPPSCVAVGIPAKVKKFIR